MLCPTRWGNGAGRSTRAEKEKTANYTIEVRELIEECFVLFIHQHRQKRVPSFFSIFPKKAIKPEVKSAALAQEEGYGACFSREGSAEVISENRS